MKPRIAILSAFATPFRSGAEACSEEVPAALRDRYDFTIITARLRRDLPREGELASGVPVLRVGFGCRFDKWLFPLLAPIAARRLKPAVIHAVLESYAGLALVCCRLMVPGGRRLLTCQSTNTSLLLGLMHRSAQAVTAISSVLVERGRRFGRADIVLIPNGLRLADMPRDAKVPGRIFFAGRHEPMKGIDTLLRAFAAVRHPHAHLRIAGDGSQHEALKSLATELGLATKVTFLGYVPVPGIYDEFSRAQVFCALSRSEALGNVFLEAQAAECAVVGTRVGGIPDIVEDGKTGLLVPPDDPGAAAQALERLLRDDALRTALAMEGMRHASQYDWSSIAARYAAVYDRLLTR